MMGKMFDEMQIIYNKHKVQNKTQKLNELVFFCFKRFSLLTLVMDD
jgi:hypothetical protein